MKTRIWELKKERFDLLLQILPVTKRMASALTERYEHDWKSRSSVAGKFDLTEHGIMKAEKLLLATNAKLEVAYGI